jgi:hypothetical protein
MVVEYLLEFVAYRKCVATYRYQVSSFALGIGMLDTCDLSYLGIDGMVQTVCDAFGTVAYRCGLIRLRHLHS